MGNLLQLLHGLAARGRVKVLQKRQPCGVNVHSQRKASGLAGHCHLLRHGRVVPRLDGRDARAAAGGDGSGRALHDLGVRAVPGKGGDAGRRTGGDQNVIVVKVVVFVAVVQRHGTHRPGKEGVLKGAAKDAERGVRLKIFVDRVHVQPHIAPGVKVADRNRAAALGTGAGDRAAAGAAVADRAGMAGAHLAARGFKNFFIGHVDFAS